MSKHTSTDIATMYLQDDEALASVNNRRIHALAKEIDQYTKEQNAEMLEALKHARDQIKEFIMIGAPLGESFDKTEERFHNNVTLREIEALVAKAEGGNP